jgi:hypothetical protein
MTSTFKKHMLVVHGLEIKKEKLKLQSTTILLGRGKYHAMFLS